MRILGHGNIQEVLNFHKIFEMATPESLEVVWNYTRMDMALYEHTLTLERRLLDQWRDERAGK